ncbi:MAG TPA: CYTH and CHAD domain-containing protein [Micromonosporaceae bacterium]|nr:CYTH and CHAD domain-containing protein [Micromonosporaceae bacterium]
MPFQERTYQVDASFTMPDLEPCTPPGGKVRAGPPGILRATYYDTADRRLARSGVFLRHLRGEAPTTAWTVRLPAGATGTRTEVSRPGGPTAVPDELCWLVAGYARGAALAPAAVLRSVRRAYQILDRTDRPVAEVADDTVTVLDGRRVALSFREIEVERLADPPDQLDRIEAALCQAGAVAGEFPAKHVRAMGAPAARPPDLVPPGDPGADPSARDVVVATLRHDIERIVEHDPFVRLRAPLRGGATPVQLMLAGCHRLCCHLDTFGALLEDDWSAKLGAEVSWLATRLDAARDGEVLRVRLHRTAAADPLAPLDPVAVARIDADLTARHEDALTALDRAISSERYLALLELLVGAAARPALTKAARGPASDLLPALAGAAWRDLAVGCDGRLGAGSLEPDAPDEEWHEVRIRARQARYAAEAVVTAGAGVPGRPPGPEALAAALAALQGVLGEHRDAATAAGTWLDIADADPDDHPLAVTAGRLHERERAAVRRARDNFDEAWRTAGRKRAVAWLT